MASDRRPTEHSEPAIVSDDITRAELEAKNGLLQFDLGKRIILDGIERGHFRLRPSTLLSLHREALQSISLAAGTYRTGPVSIGKSKHSPPDASLVPFLVEEMCEEVNARWQGQTAIWLAAYVMWRLNWIHPFTDGNGRTSRIASYVVLSVKLNALMPGTPEIPEQIVENREPYFEALEAADACWKRERAIGITALESLLGRLFEQQLQSAFKQAAGR